MRSQRIRFISSSKNSFVSQSTLNTKQRGISAIVAPHKALRTSQSSYLFPSGKTSPRSKQLQQVTTPYSQACHQRNMSTSTQPLSQVPRTQIEAKDGEDPEITRLVSYWFPTQSQPQKFWFVQSEATDSDIRSKFLPLVQAARSAFSSTSTTTSKTTSPDFLSWTSTPRGTIALLLLFDQFPRNLFRGSGESFASDKIALKIAIEAIAKEQDKELGPLERGFLYLPLMHDETLASQVGCLALYEGAVRELEGAEKGEVSDEVKDFAKMGAQLAKRHRDCIRRFGRFPARNEALGRESTVEEKEYLGENPTGF